MEGPCKSFFRVIIPDVLKEKKLELPLKFATMYGDELTGKCRLYLPNGSYCQVGVVKGPKAGEIWLQKGWSNFMDENSVKIGCFLVFDYLGSSKFQVQILKIPAACEIVDPSQLNIKDDDDEDSVQMIPNPKQKRGRGRSVQKKSGHQIVDKDENRAVLDDLQARKIIVSKQFIRSLREMSDESKKALQAAKTAAGQPENVPCFIAVMQRHNIGTGSQLNVPAEFLHQHMGGRDCEKIVTLRCGGMSLKAETVPREGGGLWIFKEWRELMKMKFSDVEAGDVGLFQKVMTQEAIELKVSIFRASEFKV